LGQVPWPEKPRRLGGSVESSSPAFELQGAGRRTGKLRGGRLATGGRRRGALCLGRCGCVCRGARAVARLGAKAFVAFSRSKLFGRRFFGLWGLGLMSRCRACGMGQAEGEGRRAYALDMATGNCGELAGAVSGCTNLCPPPGKSGATSPFRRAGVAFVFFVASRQRLFVAFIHGSGGQNRVLIGEGNCRSSSARLPGLNQLLSELGQGLVLEG